MASVEDVPEFRWVEPSSVGVELREQLERVQADLVAAFCVAVDASLDEAAKKQVEWLAAAIEKVLETRSPAFQAFLDAGRGEGSLTRGVIRILNEERIRHYLGYEPRDYGFRQEYPPEGEEA